MRAILEVEGEVKERKIGWVGHWWVGLVVGLCFGGLGWIKHPSERVSNWSA